MNLNFEINIKLQKQIVLHNGQGVPESKKPIFKFQIFYFFLKTFCVIISK